MGGFNPYGGVADSRGMTGIPSASSASALSQAQLAQEVSTRVAVKSLDAAKAQGEAAISLLQAAASVQDQAFANLEPHKGQHVDVMA